MSQQTELLKLSAAAALGLALFFVAFKLFAVRSSPPPSLGLRGDKRQRALSGGGTFKMLEPAVRQIAAWIAPLSLRSYRGSIERDLARAGYYLGLTADEFIALELLSIVAYGGFGLGIGIVFEAGVLSTLLGGALGWMLLRGQLSGERNRRYREVSRCLPVEIDLAAMCMQAGLDFPGAIRLIVQQRSKAKQVLREELLRILQELELGHTRATALSNFAARVPTLAVREFVGAVIQAEEKGTPLAEVLRIQATMLRMRRSILAEEAASRAGVLMMIPMLMLLGCILIILMGSLVIQSLESGAM
jgi:tight adherence protein C